MLLGDNVHWQDREAWIYSKDVYTRYPFQGALYGLPPEVIKECIVGAIEARFGALKPAARQRRQRHGQRAAAQRHANGNGNGNGAASRRTCRTAAPTASWRAPRRSVAAPAQRRSRAAQLRGVHLQGLGRRHRQALRHPVQPQALGGAADRDGDVLAGRPRAAARPGGDDRGRAVSRCPSRWAPTPASAIRCAAASRR